MKIDMGVVLKAGLIGAAIGVALAMLSNLVPLLVCVVCWVGPILGAASGVLYVYLSTEVGEMTDAAVGGALAVAITALASALVNIIWGFIAGSGDVFQSAGGVLGGAMLGAIGAVAYTALKKK